jgi:hypothetical protein
MKNILEKKIGENFKNNFLKNIFLEKERRASPRKLRCDEFSLGAQEFSAVNVDHRA